VRHLRSLGYTILARNFRCPLGEIDIIARQGDIIVFVEVRATRGPGFGLPEESIRTRKKAKLRRLAAYYLQKMGLEECVCRFDVVGVEFNAQGLLSRLELFVNAF
jgi:putative endonuclease